MAAVSCTLQGCASSRGRNRDGSNVVLGEELRPWSSVCDGGQGQLVAQASCCVIGGIPAPQRDVTLSVCLQRGYGEVVEQCGCHWPAGHILWLICYKARLHAAAQL